MNLEKAQMKKELKELGIYQKRFNTLQIEPETGIGDHDEVITFGKTLLFYPEMDGKIVEGKSPESAAENAQFEAIVPALEQK